MAPRKKTEAKASKKKTPAKKATPRKKAAKTAKKKSEKPVVVETVDIDDDDMFPPSMNLGEMLWEYRARMAEWERAFAEGMFTDYQLVQEKADPKYRRLFELMAEDEQRRAEIKRCASYLRGIQEKAAKKLGISLEDFLKNCTVDHDTGVVKLLD